MGIPVAKLIVYTLCANIDPMGLVPITLDVGTNNRTLLDDPLYLGWRPERGADANFRRRSKHLEGPRDRRLAGCLAGGADPGGHIGGHRAPHPREDVARGLLPILPG